MKRIPPSSVIIIAGITAALYIGKLPPAFPVLRDSLQISLVQAGLLLSLVQLAGMVLGLAMGLLADGIGHKRSMVAGAFFLYSSQWLALIGFLPTVYAQAGVAAGVAGALTALAAAANIAGNIASGRLLQRGTPPQLLLHIGFGAMGVGGLIPATLFFLAVKLAPDERAVSTTVGWMQQWSAFGQLAGWRKATRPTGHITGGIAK
jgi:MFS family permease